MTYEPPLYECAENGLYSHLEPEPSAYQDEEDILQQSPSSRALACRLAYETLGSHGDWTWT